MSKDSQPIAASASHDDPPSPRRRSRRRLGFWLPAVAALLLAAIWAVWRFHYDGADPRLIFWPRPPEPAEPAALDEIVSLHAKRRPLRAVLAELAEKQGVAIELDGAALKDVGIPVNVAVSIDLEGASLRSALALVAHQAHDDLIVVDRDGGLLVTTCSYYESTLGNYVSRVYPLGELLAGEEKVKEEDLAAAIQCIVTPESWKNVGGLGEIQSLPGALLVKQTPQAQRRVQTLLDALAQLQREPGRLEPIDVGIPAAMLPRRKRLLAALDEPSEAEFSETPLCEAITQLSKKHGIPIVLDYQDLPSVAVASDTKVTFSLQGVRLRSLLTRLLAEIGLTFAVCDDALIVTTTSGTEAPSRLHLRLYPVRDLVSHASGAPDYDSLINLITFTIARDGWTDVGGAGELACAAGALIVLQTDDVHRQIERLLADMRHTLRPSLYPAPERPEDVARRRIERALVEPVSLEFTRTPLEEAVRQIGKQAGVPVAMVPWAFRGVRTYADGPAKRVALVARDLPLEHGLWLMLREFGLDFTVTDEVLLITTPDDYEDSILTRCYNARRLDCAFESDSLIITITATVKPDTWEDAGGPGAIENLGDVLVVSQTRRVHQQVAALLAALERQLDAPESLAPTDVAVGVQQSQRRVLAALDEPAEFDFADTPLGDVAKQLSAQHHVPVLLDWQAQGFGSATPVTGRARGLRLESALRLLLRRRGLTFMVRDCAIIVTSPEKAVADGMELRLYPYAGLVDAKNPDLGSLLKFITGLIDPEVWEGGFGGPATEKFQRPDVFVVTAPRETQQRVEQMLAAMRSLRAESEAAVRPDALMVDAPPGSEEARILAALQQPADVIVSDEPLDDALRRLAREHGLPLWIEHPGTNQTPVSFTLCGATLGRALDLLLAQHSLRYCLRDGSLLIPSPSSHDQRNLSLRLYRIADLRQRYSQIVTPPRPPGPLRFGTPQYPFNYFDVPDSAPTFDAQVTDALAQCAAFPPRGGGRIARLDNALGVLGTERDHREVERVLRDIRRAHGLTVPAPPGSLLERRVSLHCRDVPLAKAVAQLSRENRSPVLLGLPHDEVDLAQRLVSCALDGVPLREVLSAISSAEPELAAIDDVDAVLLTSAKALKQRVFVRVYPLGELLDRFPELDAAFLRELVAAGVTPLVLEKTERDVPIAALPRALVVRHNAAGHAEVERLLEFVATQADELPRPADLHRDDNRSAQAALAERIRAVDDPREAQWLMELAKMIDYPTDELALALAARIRVADDPREALWLVELAKTLDHPTEELAQALAARFREVDDPREAQWLVELAKTVDHPTDELRQALVERLEPAAQQGQFALLRLILSTGIVEPDGAVLAAAARHLHHAETLSDSEIAFILSLLERRKDASAVPALVELLSGDYGIVAGRMLQKADPHGSASRAFIDRRLAAPKLSQGEREELAHLRKLIDDLFAPAGGDQP